MCGVIVVILSLVVLLVSSLLLISFKPRHYDLLDVSSRKAIDSVMPQTGDGGNLVTTFTDMGEMYDRLLLDIADARQHVHLQFFKYEADAMGQHLGSLLVSKAAEGVSCRLMYDALMCRSWRWYYRELSLRGVQTAGFGRLCFRGSDYYRNHRKAVVIDGHVAYVGGVNIAERYLHGLDWGSWRDTIIRIEGPAALAVQRAFVADWHYASGYLLAQPECFPAVPATGQLPVRILTSGPIGDGETILDYTVSMLDSAENYIWFQSPYFIPPARLFEAMQRAARRGVDVRVLLPPRGDRGETTQLASKSYFACALEMGIKICLYQPGYMHSKVVVCDDRVAMVGSCNIDPRSYRLCEEIAAVVESADYAQGMRSVFLDDESESHPITAEEWQARPARQKIGEAMARLIAPLL